jgi:uncharacterized 2Fe-2S/4Fe-4S cluster protein (DUF4445 family)
MKSGNGTISTYTIDFEPVGRRGKCHKSKSLLACAHSVGIGINSICGGTGICHSCKVQVLKGSVSKPTSKELEAFSAEERDQGWRLACQTYPLTDCKLSIPPESMTTPQRIQVEGKELRVEPELPVRAYQVELRIPSLSNPKADAARLIEELNRKYQVFCNTIEINVLRSLSLQVRSWDWRCQVIVRGDQIIGLSPWYTPLLGLAIDLGTTKVAAYLIDMNEGRTLAAKGIMNPQISFGEDIISRITHIIKSPDKSLKIRELIVEGINDLINNLCIEVGVNPEQIFDAVVVGNTAMHHLFLGLPVRQLAFSPFVPALSSALDVKAKELGLGIAPGSYVHLLPNVAGFVGSDHVAMILATGVWQDKGPILAIDIGTNTEVSLISNGRISAVSCASGPAFEGGHIKDGMRAATGAIERLRIADNKIQYQTIDEAPPIGICGSGILDTLCQLFLSGVIDAGGRIRQDCSRVRNYKTQREFVLVGDEDCKKQPAITITQHDIRELQLAKASIRTGIQVLLEANNCSENQIREVIVAGAFGTYINVASALIIGMLPSLPLGRFRQVGNAAGMGAKLALVSSAKRAEAQSLAARIKYIELGTAPNFNQTFIQASYLGQYRIREGKREGVEKWRLY